MITGRLFRFLVVLFLSFVAAGCGGGSDPVATAPPQPTPQLGTIQLNQVLLRALPSEVTHQRFTGFDAQGTVRYGPATEAKAATIELTNVSTAVVRLQIEYLQGDTVIGLGSVTVALNPGETTIIVDPPFQDVKAALSSIQVTPGGSTIADGTQQQFIAIGTFADNTQLDLTSSVTWNSSNPAAATIAAGGLATAVDPGDTKVTANVGPVSASTTLTVSGATITSISVTPGAPAIAAGTTQQFTAMATLSDASTQDVTNTANWTSGTLAAATVSGTGLATAVATGQSVMTATVGAVSGSATLTVSGATVTSVVVTPSNPTIANGTTQQYTAMANFTSGPPQDVTSSAVWTSSQTGFATIAPGGLASAVAPGTTTITATFEGQSGSTDLTVGAATIVSIAVTPGTPAIADGTTQQFTAIATLSDASMRDVTATASWMSGTPATATVDGTGLATSVDPGQTAISAAVGAVSGSATLTVTNATVISVVVTPGNPTIASGTTQQFIATANFTSGPAQDVTSSAVWTSGTTATATIAPGGLASAVAPGTTTITATFGGQSGNTDLTVGAATIASIAVTPAVPAIADGTTQQFTATATLTDGSTQDVTTSADWTSATPGTATIETMGQTNPGLATAVDPGQSVITASVGAVSGNTTLTVTNATIQSIAIDPPLALSAPGTKRQYTATATFSDNSTQDVSSQVIWSANNGVTMANDNLGPNKVGQATIPLTGATSPVTVMASLGALNANATLNLGSFAYVANYFDNNVSVYTINPTTGALTAGTPVASGLQPRSVTVDPSGRFAYVTNASSNDVSVYTINHTTGALTAGTPVAAGNSPFSVTVDPSGRFAYVTNLFSRNVSVYTINPTTGVLTPGTAVAAGNRPVSVTVDPGGRFAYVANTVSNDVSVYTINPSTGALTAGTSVSAGNAPNSVTVDPSGRFAYTANYNSNNVSVYTINPSTGALAPGPAVAAGINPSSVRVDPSGRFAYVANNFDDNVSVYTINPTTGALTAGTPVGAGSGPSSVTTDPSGRFAYVANNFDDKVWVYTINPTTGALTAGTPVAAGDSPFSIVTTP